MLVGICWRTDAAHEPPPVDQFSASVKPGGICGVKESTGSAGLHSNWPVTLTAFGPELSETNSNSMQTGRSVATSNQRRWILPSGWLPCPFSCFPSLPMATATRMLFYERTSHLLNATKAKVKNKTVKPINRITSISPASKTSARLA